MLILFFSFSRTYLPGSLSAFYLDAATDNKKCRGACFLKYDPGSMNFMLRKQISFMPSISFNLFRMFRLQNCCLQNVNI